MTRTVQTFRAGAEALTVLHHAVGVGPSVVITANIHGDELTGVHAVHALDAHLEEGLVKGSVALYPSLNPGGLKARTRVHPSGHDLNRLFPGVQRGSPAEQHNHRVWSDLVARRPDVVVDLHADSVRSIPYAIVDRALASGRSAGRTARLVELARATGLTVLHEYPDDQYVRYSLDRSLAGALVNRAGIAAVTIEAGPRRWVDPVAVQTTVAATLGVLRHLGMVSAGGAEVVRAAGGPWRRAAAPRSRKAGLFVANRRAGDSFQKGDVLGTILDPAGTTVDRLVAEGTGVVVSWSDSAWLPAGSAAGTIGVEERRA